LKIPKGLIAVTQSGTDNTMFEDTKGLNPMVSSNIVLSVPL
jgi:hypothetical protein